MKTLGEILKLSTEFLAQKKIAHPRRQVELLLCDLMKLSRMALYMNAERPLSDEEVSTCRAAVMRRSKGEPVAYITESLQFLNCVIKTSPAALIPRQETEILTDMISKELSDEPKFLWDICCGSGCIGIALKKKFPSLNVVSSDLSEKALNLAKENAAANGVSIEFLLGDLLAPFKGRKADFVVCNPPYISETEFATLDPEVKNFEPKMALLAGKTGLEFYQRLAAELPLFLLPGAKVWFEIGFKQGNDLLALFNQKIWRQSGVQKDWAGHDRFFFLEKE